MNAQEFVTATRSEIENMTSEQMSIVLDDIGPPFKWGTVVTLERLHFLSTEAMEVILSRLPQCGALAEREAGDLRVQYLGFNCMIAGRSPHVGFKIDFGVRCNGFRAGINLLVRPRPDRLSDNAELPIPDVSRSALELFSEFRDEHGLRRFEDYELILLKMFRPASPTSFQWGTAGGQFDCETTDDFRSVAIRETREEFNGFLFFGWSPLLVDKIYQSGNIYELQSTGVALGMIPDDKLVQLAGNEGIVGHYMVNLAEASAYLDHPVNVNHDGKIHHGLLALELKLLEAGMTRT